MSACAHGVLMGRDVREIDGRGARYRGEPGVPDLWCSWRSVLSDTFDNA